MKKTLMITLLACSMLMPAMAQENTEDKSRPPKGNADRPKDHPQRVTVEQINHRMLEDLKLTEQQAKRVNKLNKKYASIIEGEKPGSGKHAQGGAGRAPGGMGGGMQGEGFGGMGGMGGGMQGGPGGGMGGPQGAPGQGGNQQQKEDLDRMQTKYEKKLRKILNEEQYEGYQKIKPQFESQRRNREFLLHGKSLE